MFDNKTLDNIILCLKGFDIHHIDETELSKQLHHFNEIIKNNHIQIPNDQIAFIINSLSSMSSVCEKYKQYTTAILMYQSLETYYNFTNDTYNDFIYINKLSGIYQTIMDYNNALKYANKAYMLRKENFGEMHPDTLMSLNTITSIYINLCDFKNALKYGKKLIILVFKYMAKNILQHYIH